MKKLTYITYQTFPADTANSIQTISNIKYFVKNGINVDLIYPLREKNSSSDINHLKKHYSFSENFNLIGTKHPYPHGKIKLFPAIWFHLSHFLWSKKIIKTINKNYVDTDLFITRSDWIFYFLSKKNKKVIFECHQYSKIRRFLLSKSLKKENSKIIFLNENLKNDYKNKKDIKDKSIVLHNGVDFDLFNNEFHRNKNEIVFIGQLTRFNQSRNIEFIIESISKLGNNFKFKIIGASEEEISRINKISSAKKIKADIKVIGRKDREAAINEIKKAEIGLLINSNENEHSTKYTSPLKYFEYLAAELKILAVDFNSHRKLPFADNIVFFKDKDFKSFKLALEKVYFHKHLDKESIYEISLDNRIKNIIKFSKI